MASSDFAIFFGQLLRRPHEVVALAPSSAVLARAMAAGIGPETGRVAELGPGTGKLTRAILARGIAPEDLTMFELNPRFCEELRARFPGTSVLHQPAQQVGEMCDDLGAVISGLPLLSMAETTQHAIVGGAFRALRPGGIFVQYTYGPVPPLADSVRRELGLVAIKGRKVWANLPPARVWTFRRASEL